jgi:creatinine amidohydrolase
VPDLLSPFMTTVDIAAARPTMAVISVGAIEQHGPHLPVGTDFLWIQELSRRVATGLNAYWVPALPFSMSECHGPTAGTIWIQPETLAEVIRDLVTFLEAQAIHRIVLLNGHGGNFVLETVVQELNATHPDLRLIMPTWYGARTEGPPIFQSAGLEVHAGESETSTQLSINAAHVGDNRPDFVPSVGREFLDYAYISNLSPLGVWGNASQATLEKGQLSAERTLNHLLRSIPEIFTTLDRLRETTAAGVLA